MLAPQSLCLALLGGLIPLTSSDTLSDPPVLCDLPEDPALAPGRPLVGPPPALPGDPLQEFVTQGFYTDKVSYAPGDSIGIHDYWPGVKTRYRVLRVQGRGGQSDLSNWLPVLECDAPETVESPVPAPYEIPYGSFVEFSDIDLASQARFTMAGWVYPTYLQGSLTILAGQYLGDVSPTATTPAGSVGVAAVGIDENGELFACAETDGGRLVARWSTPLEPHRWHYVAATFNGRKLRLYSGGDDGYPMATPTCLALRAVEPSGPAPLVTLESSADADGLLLGGRYASVAGAVVKRGALDGRIDQWRVWDAALNSSHLNHAMSDGLEDPITCGGSAPTATLVLDTDFEEDYASHKDLFGAAGDRPFVVNLADPPANPGDPLNGGSVVNFGSPGVSGRAGGAGLRLRYDQVINAEMGLRGTIAIPTDGSWPSGMYVLQAVFEEGPDSYEPCSAVNKEPWHFAAFAVRPATTPPARSIAVVLPTNTWMAYNSWPGARGSEAAAATAPGLLTRRLDPDDPSSRFVTQGNNSVYGETGDGETHGYYSGWRRPNLNASPILAGSLRAWGPGDYGDIVGFTPNRSDAYTNAKFIEWLEGPTGGILSAGAGTDFEYHVFADRDLHDGTLDMREYAVVCFVGHAEYWSEAMLGGAGGVVKRVSSGGHVVSVTGNSITWRSELSEGANQVLEVRKWPSVVDRVGPGSDHTKPAFGEAERTSFLAGGLIGAWRFVNLVGTLDGAPLDSNATDLILGTLPVIVGNSPPWLLTPDYFGELRVRSSYTGGTPDPFWGTLADAEVLTEVGRIFGPEADAYPHDLLGHTVSWVPAPSAFPFADPSSAGLRILGEGVNFLGCWHSPTNTCPSTGSNYPPVLPGVNGWNNSVYTNLNGSGNPITADDIQDANLAHDAVTFPDGEVAQWLFVGEPGPVGHAVSYSSPAGAVVLNIATQDAPIGLWRDPAAGADNRMSRMLELVLDTMMLP